MCDSDRSALRNLSFEQRNNASVASEYIPETYRRKGRAFGMAGHHLNHHLAHPLAGSHDVCRVDSFIRRNQDKFLCTVFIGKSCRIIGTKYIVLDCLIWACLHKRNMFMRRRMEDKLWMVSGKYFFQTSSISHRADQCHQIHGRVFSAKLLFNIVGIIFINIKDNELFRSIGRNLPAKFASNRTASSRDKYDLVFDIG